MTDDTEPPSFDIPVYPERHYPPGGGVEYEGRTVFALHADPPMPQSDLQEHLQAALDGGTYTYGDRDGLPAPVYLVHDRDRRTVFRAVVRDGRLELHVLPNTDAETLEAVYERLCECDGVDWNVECRTSDGNYRDA